MSILNKSILAILSNKPGLLLPENEQLLFPEKIIQFGTGVLLRGLPDYYVDQSSREQKFKGRIVVVKSTSSGDIKSFNDQDCLYTISVRGIRNGQKVDESIINSSISRVLSAKDDWQNIIECATNPDMQIVISNTTEVGIALLADDDIHASPPSSYPGKLLAFLLKRFSFFNGRHDAGMVILPTELISDNGKKLLSILLQLAEINKLDKGFIDWLKFSNYFCNTLVDRIVPGKLNEEDLQHHFNMMGYQDDLMIMAEPFSLWAIESSEENVKKILGFVDEKNGCLLVPDIEKFKELKLRLLNGTHSFCCGVSFLGGFELVRNTMTVPSMLAFIKKLSCDEIVDAITGPLINKEEATHFANSVLERFSNPFIDHKWSSIAVQYATKMKMRTVPLIKWYYEKMNKTPQLMAFGFAAFLIYMKCQPDGNGGYVGVHKGLEYKINDDHASYFASQWKHNAPDVVVASILSDKSFWGEDLSLIKGFQFSVTKYVNEIMENDIEKIITTLQRINP